MFFSTFIKQFRFRTREEWNFAQKCTYVIALTNLVIEGVIMKADMNEYLNLNLTSEHIQAPLQHKLSSIASSNVMAKRSKLQS